MMPPPPQISPNQQQPYSYGYPNLYPPPAAAPVVIHHHHAPPVPPPYNVYQQVGFPSYGPSNSGDDGVDYELDPPDGVEVDDEDGGGGGGGSEDDAEEEALEEVMDEILKRPLSRWRTHNFHGAVEGPIHVAIVIPSSVQFPLRSSSSVDVSFPFAT